MNENEYPTATRLRLRPVKNPQPLCGWDPSPLLTKGSQIGNPGLKDVIALRFTE
jgi:hypothetical protein